MQLLFSFDRDLSFKYYQYFLANFVLFQVSSQSSSVRVNLHQESESAFVDISLPDTSIASFSDIIVEIKSRLTSQVARIIVSYQSTRQPISAQFNTVDQCPTSDSAKEGTDVFSGSLFSIIFFTIFVIVFLLCRTPRRPRSSPHPGVSPYAHQSPYPNDSRNTQTFSTPYTRSDVGTSRGRQSPVLARRHTPGSSPRGLFSVTQ